MAESQQEKYYRKLNEDRARSERAAKQASKEREQRRAAEERRKEENDRVYSGMWRGS